jgi:Family of unknown function (DUF5715)
MAHTRKFVWIVLIALVAPAFGLVATPRVRSRHKRKPHKMTWFEYRVFMPSHENLLSQNNAIDELGLPRLQDDKALKFSVEEAELVPITHNQYVRISPKLEAKRRFCKPWVDMFLQELGQAYYERFGDQIQVNSAVRTVRTQMHLLRINHNAAPAHGETASAHLAGIAVDLQRRGLTPAQVHFIQKKLLYLSNLNMVIVEEELKQPCFHVVVTGDYPYPPPMPIMPTQFPNLFTPETPDGDASARLVNSQ